MNTINTMKLFYPLAILAGFGIGSGCLQDLPAHCGNNNGDYACAAAFGDGSYCSSCILEANGCTNEIPSEDCHVAGVDLGSSGNPSDADGTSMDTTQDPNLTSGADGTSSTSEAGETTLGIGTTSVESTDTGWTTGDGGCETHSDCPNQAPLCKENLCVPCDDTDANDDAECQVRNEQAPVCSEGQCVECRSDAADECGDDEACNVSVHLCVPQCKEHADCAGVACNLYDGYCFPSTNVVDVPGDYATIADGIYSFASDEQGTVIVHAGIYSTPVIVDDGRMVALLADDITTPPTWNSLTTPQLVVTDGTVYLDGMSISEYHGMTPAVQLTGAIARARLWADRSRIVNNDAGAILLESEAEATIRNSFLGGDRPLVEALEVRGNNTVATVSYSTLIAGQGDGMTGGDRARALECLDNPTVTVSDSVLLNTGAGGTINCPDAVFTRSASESLGGMNTNVGGFDGMQQWFENLSAGDFRLLAAGEMIFFEIARWNIDDPPTDILGNPRPQMDNEKDYAGAHRP